MGRSTKNNGDIFLGMYRGGQRVGNGTYLYNNGNRYSGEWNASLKSGFGIIEYINGSIF